MLFDWQARRMVSGLHLNKFYLQAMSWPKLTGKDADTLAEAARDLLNFSPRFRDIAPQNLRVDPTTIDYVATNAAIETTVAAGYRLTTGDLEQLYSIDETDRRGFWRHYASDPHAHDIVERVLAGRGATSLLTS
jgi:hypothetical protein